MLLTGLAPHVLLNLVYFIPSRTTSPGLARSLCNGSVHTSHQSQKCPVWWRHFLSWDSPFPKDLALLKLCQCSQHKDAKLNCILYLPVSLSCPLATSSLLFLFFSPSLPSSLSPSPVFSPLFSLFFCFEVGSHVAKDHPELLVLLPLLLEDIPGMYLVLLGAGNGTQASCLLDQHSSHWSICPSQGVIALRVLVHAVG